LTYWLYLTLYLDFFSGVMSPRQGRNSKLMNFGSEPENKALPLKIKADTEDESVKNIIEEIKKVNFFFTIPDSGVCL
jgi:hypothetical protein